MLEALYVYRNQMFLTMFDPLRGRIFIDVFIFYKYTNPLGSISYDDVLNWLNINNKKNKYIVNMFEF